MTQDFLTIFAQGGSPSAPALWLGGIIVILAVCFLLEFLTTLRNVKLSDTVLDLSWMEYMCWHVYRFFHPGLDDRGGFDDDCLRCQFILFVHKSCGWDDGCPPNDQSHRQPPEAAVEHKEDSR